MTVTVSVSARSVVVVTEGRRNTTVMVFQYPVKIALALQPPRGSKQKPGATFCCQSLHRKTRRAAECNFKGGGEARRGQEKAKSLFLPSDPTAVPATWVLRKLTFPLSGQNLEPCHPFMTLWAFLGSPERLDIPLRGQAGAHLRPFQGDRSRKESTRGAGSGGSSQEESKSNPVQSPQPDWEWMFKRQSGQI